MYLGLVWVSWGNKGCGFRPRGGTFANQASSATTKLNSIPHTNCCRKDMSYTAEQSEKGEYTVAYNLLRTRIRL